MERAEERWRGREEGLGRSLGSVGHTKTLRTPELSGDAPELGRLDLWYDTIQ